MKTILLTACGIALIGIAQALEPAPEPETVGDLHALLAQGIEHPALYNHFYKDIVRVKFPDTCCVRLRDGQPKDAAAPGTHPAPTERIASDTTLAGALAELASRGAKWERSCSLPEARIDDLVARAYHHTPGETHPDLNNYLCLHLPETLTSGEAVNLLRGIPCIEAALLLSKSGSAPSEFTSDVSCIPDFTDPTLTVFEGYQAYLDPAPAGIDARYAWEGTGGDGSGITIVNIEGGFIASHVDLPEITVFGEIPRPAPGDRNHGTSVFGIVGGVDNGFGVKGIAYGADLAFSSVRRDPFFGGIREDIPDAISRAMDEINEGDVIMLEWQVPGPNAPANPSPANQFGLVPVSFQRDTYDMIRIAIAANITVCEAAGNGAQDLDVGYTNNSSDRVPGFAMNTGPFTSLQDTGSIIVGAGDSIDLEQPNATPLVARSPSTFTNFGSTVDLQGWGLLVSTTGGGDTFRGSPISPTMNYTAQFGGTSSALPIVVSSCAIIQRAFQLKNGRVATPAEIRTILRTTGTPQTGSLANNIGPLPNLRAAIESLASPGIVGGAAPVVDPPAGEFTDPFVSVTLDYSGPDQDMSNTRVHYTLNGSEPTLDSFLYIPGPQERIVIAASATLSARLFHLDTALGRWFGGAVSRGEYIVGATPRAVTPIPFLVGSGPLFSRCYQAPLEIRFVSATPDAFFRYRLDGDRDLLFNQDVGIYIEGGETLRLPIGSYQLIAVAYAPGFNKSQISPTLNIRVAEDCAIPPLNSVRPLFPPRIFPDGGTFPGFASVSLTSPTAVHYTTDGSEPTTSSPSYGFAPIVLNASATIKAKSFLAGFTPSETVSAEFTILGENSLTAPAITPAAGNYTSSVTLTMLGSNPQAALHYTTNGATPTEFSPVYTNPIQLGIGIHTVRARLFFDGVAPSPITTQTYTVNDPATLTRSPEMSPRGGNHTGATQVILTSFTAGATIHYTIDDLGTVTESDLRYTPGTPIVLQPSDAPQIIRARAFRNGIGSPQEQQSFRIFTPVGNCEFALFTPGGGTYNNPVDVILSSSTPSVTFKTTDDGTHPNTSDTADTQNRSTGAFVSPTLSIPFTISRSGTYRATAQRLAFNNSGLSAQEYRFVCGSPESTPPTGTYTGSVEVALSSATDTARIHYTTDGTEPTSNSPRYTSPFTLGTGLTTVNTIAFKSGFEDSEPASLVYNVVPASPEPSAPTITRSLADITASAGVEVILLGDATGFPEPDYSWKFNGTTLAFFGKELVIPRTQTGNSGTYEMTATNTSGSVSTSAMLTVEAGAPRPEIASVVMNATGTALDLSFPTESGKRYQVETSTTGAARSWSPSGAAFTGTGSPTQATIPVPADTPVLLIRIALVPE